MNHDPTAVIHTNPVYPGAPAPAPKRNRRLTVLAAVVGAAVVVGGAGAALAWPSSPKTADVSASVSAPPAEIGDELAVEADTTATAADATDVPAPDADAAKPTGSGGSAKPGGSGSGGTGNSGGGKAAAAPSIKSFSTPENIDCHNGNLQHFSAKWSTANAEKVTISIDGSGIYDTYGPNGETSLPFNCSSSHTFLLKAYSSDAKSVSKSVTLKPRNVPSQGPPSSTGED